MAVTKGVYHYGGRPAMYAKTRKNKYGNLRTEVDGISFASAKEARRYGELKLLERAGQISELRLQPRYKLTMADVLICTYVGDFEYRENGSLITEDSKGVRTDVFRIKAALFEALYGRAIRIT